MKRTDLIRRIELHHCRFTREGARHSIFMNAISNGLRSSQIPEIGDFLAKKICTPNYEMSQTTDLIQCKAATRPPCMIDTTSSIQHITNKVIEIYARSTSKNTKTPKVENSSSIRSTP